MDFATDIAKLKEQLDKAKDVLIVTHERPTADSIGSALTLYLALSAMGKKVTVACPDPITVELSSFVGANKVVSEVSKKNFIISLDYIEGSIEKVSYNIEGNKFNLVIEPREGFDPFTQDKVQYSYAGSAADVILAVDTIHLGGLKKLYDADKELYASKPVINIDRHPNNVHFGQVNLVDPQAATTAEIVGTIIAGLGVELNEDMATNLYNAVAIGTNNFTNANTSAGAFELAAKTLRAGGKRFKKSVATNEELPKIEAVTAEPKQSQTPAPEAPKPAGKPAEAPADWLKPKIFKSSNLL